MLKTHKHELLVEGVKKVEFEYINYLSREEKKNLTAVSRILMSVIAKRSVDIKLWPKSQLGFLLFGRGCK